MKLLASLLPFCLLLQAGLQAQTPRPNIVVILADDMGYGDVHALNPNSRIPTPNLDRLAAQGVTFTDAHTPSAVCTPTRYGLLTGRYCWRSRLKRGVLNGYSPPLIEPERPTLASFLKSQAYTCGIVGKWHLGLGLAKKEGGQRYDFTRPVADGPNTLGFDFSYIIPASLDFPPYMFIRNGRITQQPVLTQAAQNFPAFLRRGERAPDLVMAEVLDRLLEEALGFIRRESSDQQEPFFLYFALTAPHKPVLPHPRFRGRSGLGPYGDFIVQVDWTVGQVLKTIEQENLLQSTLVIYTSDNGSFMYRRDEPDATGHVDDETIQAYRADRHRPNHIFRGTKADIWEAGHRVPFFVRWPGRIQPGSRSDQTICLTDLFATLAEILGAEPPPGAAPDSFSFWPDAIGATRKTPRPPVIHHSANGMFAIRQGRGKLVLGNGSGGREQPRGKPFQTPYHLYDLSQDPAEKENLIEKEPEWAAGLESSFQQIRKAVLGDK